MLSSPTSSSDWRRTFRSIKESHDNAYSTIERAIKLEEQERPDLAFNIYKEGIQLIDDALAISVEVPPNFQKDEDWEKACNMIHKMKQTRGEVILRIGQLAAKFPNSVPKVDLENLPKIENRPRTYQELAEALKDMKHCEVNTGGLELLFSCDGVKMYYIHSSGKVSSSMEKYTMRIVQIEKDDVKKLDSSAFVQVIKTSESIRIENVEEPLFEDEGASGPIPQGIPVPDVSFIYPLVPGVSPCFRTDFGAFILPDLQCNDGSAVGLIVPENVDEIVIEIFTALLHGIVYQEEGGIVFGGPKLKRRTSVIVSENIIKGAFYISKGLVKGAEKAGEYISYGTPYVKSKLPKAEDGSVEMSQGVKTGVKVAKTVTGTAASVTGYLAEKVGCATMALGRFLAPHVQKHGSNLLSYSTGWSEQEAQEKVSGILTVCAGAVEGFGTVYGGLEESATILGKSLSNNTVQIVEHTYGSQAGEVVGTSLDTVGNVINLSQNVNSITAKGIAKRTAKNAGKAIILTNRPPIPKIDNLTPGQTITASSLYPDLTAFAEVVVKNSGTEKDVVVQKN